MKLGDVLRFTTDQAIGHDLRNKFHVFIGKTDHHRARAELVFMFISSGNYGGCYPVSKSDYDFLDYDSFISCGGLVFYSPDFLRNMTVTQVGSIQRTHLIKLRNHLIDHEFMPGWQITITCNQLPA